MKVVFLSEDGRRRLRIVALPAPPSVGDHVTISGLERHGRHYDQVWEVVSRHWHILADHEHGMDRCDVYLKEVP